jgi:hypothetical protein
MIRATWWWWWGGSRKCHQMRQGGGVFSKMTRDIFWAKRRFWSYLRPILVFIVCHVIPGSPNDTWGRGSKIGQKSVTYYLNDPLSQYWESKSFVWRETNKALKKVCHNLQDSILIKKKPLQFVIGYDRKLNQHASRCATISHVRSS